MSIVEEMLRTHPVQGGMDAAVLADCIQACVACAQCCTTCADACLSEEGVDHLVRCIGLNADCADICATTGRVLSRPSTMDPGVLGAVLALCASACRACAEECEGHAKMHEHCRICAECCRRCERACTELLAALG